MGGPPGDGGSDGPADVEIIWTARALDDLERLHAFLAAASPPAAASLIQRLVSAPDVLQAQPRIGTPLNDFRPREIRYLLVGPYELRYEVRPDAVWILRLWHTREQRLRAFRGRLPPDFTFDREDANER